MIVRSKTGNSQFSHCPFCLSLSHSFFSSGRERELFISVPQRPKRRRENIKCQVYSDCFSPVSRGISFEIIFSFSPRFPSKFSKIVSVYGPGLKLWGPAGNTFFMAPPHAGGGGVATLAPPNGHAPPPPPAAAGPHVADIAQNGTVYYHQPVRPFLKKVIRFHLIRFCFWSFNSF